MKLMKITAAIQEHKVFLATYSLLLLAGLYPWLACDKIRLLLKINQAHHPMLDRFFYYITNLGSGITYGLLMLVLWAKKVPHRKLLIGIISFIVMTSIVQFLKRIVFPNQPRPIVLIPDPTQLHLVKQASMLQHFSFPSGHAATIFVAACFLNLLFLAKHPGYGILLLFIATIVAYSRMYLGQHFYIDVYVGALIGGWATMLSYAWLQD